MKRFDDFGKRLFARSVFGFERSGAHLFLRESGIFHKRQTVGFGIFTEAGSQPKIMAAGKWMLRLAGLVNSFMREMVEMHYLLTTPVIMDDTALSKLLGALNKTAYADGIKQTLAAMRGVN